VKESPGGGEGCAKPRIGGALRCETAALGLSTELLSVKCL